MSDKETKLQASTARPITTKQWVGETNHRNHPKLMVENTNVLKVGTSGSSAVDRHTFRPATKSGRMKCDACYDYNDGVASGHCTACGNKNKVFR